MLRLQQKMSGKILEFKQDASFHIRTGDRLMEENKSLKALYHYRKALEKNPADPEALLVLSEQLNALGRFEESNRLVFVFTGIYGMLPEFLFGTACNFYGMSEFEYAQEALEAYLKMDPEGCYAEEAEEFLSVLTDDDELGYATGIGEEEDFSSLTVCQRVRNLLAAGERELALEVLKQELAEVPDSQRTRILYAQVLEESGMTQKARTVLGNILREDPNNLQAKCRLAHLMHLSKKDSDAKDLMITVDTRQIESPWDWAALARTREELGQLKEALEAAARAKEDMPYEREILHLYGRLSHFLQDDKAAEECYRTLLDVDPSDQVAVYYLDLLKKKDGNDKLWTADYRLPASETVKRLKKLSDLLNRDIREIRIMYEKDNKLKYKVNWALTEADDSLKEKILDLYTDLGDECALRDFALRSDQKDEFKKQAIIRLSMLGAMEPYMAYLGSEWIQTKAVLKPDAIKMPDTWKSILDRIDRHSRDPEVRMKAKTILTMYIRENGADMEAPKGALANAFAAALTYFGREFSGYDVIPQDLCKEFNVTYRKLSQTMEQLLPGEK